MRAAILGDLERNSDAPPPTGEPIDAARAVRASRLQYLRCGGGLCESPV